MKKLLLILTLCFAAQGFAQYDEEEVSNLNWLTDIDEAKKEAVTAKKPILLFFTGSDWCPPCKTLKKDFFNSEAFEKKSEQFVLVMVDIPRRTDIITPEQRKKNEVLVGKYNKNGGYPNLVALNSNLNIIGELSGYTFLRETDTHFNFIDSVLENY
jgi:thioredoxin-related protein